MKKLMVSLYVCLALVVLPLASQAADHPKVDRATGILSSAVVFGAVGLLVGSIIAAGAQSSSGGPVLAGLAIGAGLGAVYAVMNPETPGPVQAAEVKDTVYPPGVPAAKSPLAPAVSPDEGAGKTQ